MSKIRLKKKKKKFFFFYLIYIVSRLSSHFVILLDLIHEHHVV